MAVGGWEGEVCVCGGGGGRCVCVCVWGGGGELKNSTFTTCLRCCRFATGSLGECTLLKKPCQSGLALSPARVPRAREGN